MSVSVRPQRSSRRYQSALLRARRDTSRPSTIPTCPSATSAVRRAKPLRSTTAGARQAEVFVEYDGLLCRPAKRGCLGDQGILALHRFAIVLDLSGGGLAKIDVSRAVQM